MAASPRKAPGLYRWVRIANAANLHPPGSNSADTFRQTRLQPVSGSVARG